MATQCERVLKAARAYNGTCAADWLADHTPDGGPRITRVAARINDLREQGHEFEILHDRHGTRVYRLVDVPSSGRPASPPPIPPVAALNAGKQPCLFDLEPKTSSHYDEAA